MKKNMKRSLAAALTLAMMLTGLAGCGEKNQNDASSGAPASSQSASGALSQQEKPGTGAKLTQESILDYPVTDPDSFRLEYLDSGCVIAECYSKDEVVVVPEEFHGVTVVGIADYGMCYLDARAIVLPDTVKEIGEFAFTDCKKLEMIHLGSGLELMRMAAFNFCDNLKQVIFPDGMKEFQGYPISLCPSLEKIVVPSSITKIPGGIVSPDMSPKAYIVTPEGSAADAFAAEYGIPVQRP